MRNARIHIRPETVFLGGELFPEADRALVGEGEADNRLDRLEAVFPRGDQPDRRAVLVRQRLAIDAGGEEGQLVLRLFDGQPLDIGPRVPGLFLARRHLGVEEGFHAQIFRARGRLRHLHQVRQRHARPGNGHRPGLDTAVPVEPFLGPAHGGDQILGIHCQLLLDHAVDGDGPRVGLHLAGLLPDVLRGPELVEIGVGGGVLLVRDRAVEHIILVARERIAADGGHRGAGHAATDQARCGETEPGEAGGLQPFAAVHIDGFGCGGGFRQLPGPALLDQHGHVSLITGGSGLRNGGRCAVHSDRRKSRANPAPAMWQR